jgi:hypothetical protein
MQGRSIGSKRFNVGEAAPQPTRASIHQEENTPLEWTAAHDLRAQLALPQRPAELHPRALRHGLIASQLGLPMLARAEKKHAPEAWDEPAAESVVPAQAHAAASGAPEYAGLDWSNNEQTTRYDEWELQKELVTYQETYPGYDTYDEHPRLDFQLPPVAAGHEGHEQRHELDHAQAAYAPTEYFEHEDHASSPGSYPFAHSAQPSAARWHSEQPIRRVADHSDPRTATQGSFAHPSQPGPARAPLSLGATARAAEPRTVTQTGFVAHAPLHTGFRGEAHVAPTLNGPQHAAARTAAPRAARAAQPHAGFAAHTPQANALGHAGIAAHGTPPHAQRVAHSPHANTPTHGRSTSHSSQANAPTHAGIATHANTPAYRGFAAQAHAAPNAAATHAGFAARVHAPLTARTQAAATRSYAGAAGSGVQRRAPRRDLDDEPVVYPRGGSWLKRVLVLLALAGAGYAAHHYYHRAPAPLPAPSPPPPPAAAVPPAEPSAPPAATIEPSSEAQAAPISPESAKERRSAARAALIAERWRERHAARRGSDDDSGDDRDESTARGRSYARASDSNASAGSDRDVGADRNRSSTSAHDDYVNDRHAAAQSGTLRINSLPWSQVHIDGQLVGHTPQMNLLLPAGKHRVTLVNNEMQLSKSLTVQIKPGNITTHTINLAE